MNDIIAKVDKIKSGLSVEQCALLVMSCDAYDDLWQPFFTLFDKHWPDCPFPVFLGAEERSWVSPKVVTLKSVAGGRNWTGRLIDYLQQLSQSHVIVILDDFFLRKQVPTQKVLHCLEFAHTHDAIQVRLIPRPGPTIHIEREPLVGECLPGLPYRLSTQVAIWNRTRLAELLHPGESIWEFEHNGNQRALAFTHGFYAVRHAVLPYEGFFAHHVVEKGKWLSHEKWIFSRQNIGCDFSRRGTLSLGRVTLYHAASIIDVTLSIFPWRMKRFLKRNIKKILHPLLGEQFSNMSGVTRKLKPGPQ